MAERRMFSRAVVGSARFLKMPVSSRLLYYDLGMEADDDGFVEAFGVLRRTGATEDDLRVLVSRSFVKVLNEDLVAYISDWKQNNYIRPDRYHPSQYKNLLLQIDVGLPSGIPAVDQRYTEVRLGKGSIGKDSIGKDSIGEKGTQEKGVKGEKPMSGLQDFDIRSVQQSVSDQDTKPGNLAAYYRNLLARSLQENSAGENPAERNGNE